jgi:hypothetical protein
VSKLAWIHISDWHERGSDFARTVVRDAFITDLAGRASLDPALASVGFLVFSGDIAFSGKTVEYEAVRHTLILPALDALQLSPDRIVAVPGNHDVDRAYLAWQRADWLEELTTRQSVAEAQRNQQALRYLLDPFTAYSDFVRSLSGMPPEGQPAFGSRRVIRCGDIDVVVLGINSALASGRARNAKGEVNDEGRLFIGEPQLHTLLTDDAGAGLRIAVMHHPFHWLAGFERNHLRRKLLHFADFILHGHEHTPAVDVIRGTSGEGVILPAGGSYHMDTTYAKSYNMVVVDFDKREATVYLRRWSDVRDAWIADTELHDNGVYCFPLPNRVSEDGRTDADTDTKSSSSAEARASAISVREYKRRIAADYSFADHRGIAGITGSPFAAALAADDLYVAPNLVPADRPEMRERERDLLKLLGDPDLPASDRGGYEEEYAALTGQQWELRRSAAHELSLGSALKDTNHVVLLGSPGVGKSALTRFLARTCVATPEEMTARLGWSEDLLPVVTPLAGFAEARNSQPLLTLREFILNAVEERGDRHVRTSVESRLAAGGVMILLDGIDEIPNSQVRTRLVRAVDRFLADHPLARCVVTSRPYGYIRLAGPITHLRLPNFSAQQVEEFVRRYFVATERHANPTAPNIDKAYADATALLDELTENQRVAELATNPLMLVIIALIRYERAHLIDERVQLYHRAVITLLDTWVQWRASAASATRQQSLPIDRLLRVWGAAAEWMHRTRPTGVVHRNELLRELARVIEEMEFDDNKAADDLADEYYEAAAGCGLLEERATDILAFWHPTFEEYLAAVDCATPTAQATDCILPLRDDPRWREVVLLSVGYVGLVQLDAQTAGEIVEAIAEKDPSPWEPVLQQHLRLAGAVLTDYPGVRRSTGDRVLTRLALSSATPVETRVPETFARACRALWRLKPSPELAKALAIAARSSKWQARMASARIAGNGAAQNDAACVAVCDGLSSDTDPDVECYAAFGLIRAGRNESQLWAKVFARVNSPYTGLEPILRGFLAAQESPALLSFLDECPAMGEFLAVTRRAGRLDEELRAHALASLRQRYSADSVEHLRAIYELDGPTDAVVDLARAAGSNGDPRARLGAAEILIEIGDRDAATDALISILRDTDADVSLRDEAFALVSSGTADRDALAEAISVWAADPDNQDPYEVVYGMSEPSRFDPAFRAMLAERWLSSQNPELVTMASELGAPAELVVPALKTMFEASTDASRQVHIIERFQQYDVPLADYGERLRDLLRIKPRGSFTVSASEMLMSVSDDASDAELALEALRDFATTEGPSSRMGSLAMVRLIDRTGAADAIEALRHSLPAPSDLFSYLRLGEALLEINRLDLAVELMSAPEVGRVFGRSVLASRLSRTRAFASLRSLWETDDGAQILRSWGQSGDETTRLAAAGLYLEHGDHVRGLDAVTSVLRAVGWSSWSRVYTAATANDPAEQRRAWSAVASVVHGTPSSPMEDAAQHMLYQTFASLIEDTDVAEIPF